MVNKFGFHMSRVVMYEIYSSLANSLVSYNVSINIEESIKTRNDFLHFLKKADRSLEELINLTKDS